MHLLFEERYMFMFNHSEKNIDVITPNYGLKDKINAIFKIFTLNLKILFNSNNIDTTKDKIELLNEYFKIKNKTKVISLYENLISTYTFDNTDISALKNVCNSYVSKKEYSKLLETVEKTIETMSLPPKDISCFKMYKGIALLALKQTDKYRIEINSICNIEIDNTIKYDIFIRLAFVFMDLLKEYNEAFYAASKAAEFISSIDFKFLSGYYSLLTLVFCCIKEENFSRLSFRISQFIKNESKLKFEHCYFVGMVNCKIAQKMQKNEIYNVSVKFLKKAARLAQNDKQLTVCFALMVDCFAKMQKFYQARGYSKLVIKHTNSETLKAKYKQLLSAHYYFTAEYQKSLETSRELLNHLDIFEESFVLACIAINQFRLNQFEEAEKNIKKAKLLNSKNKEIHDIINTYYEAIMTDKNK